MSHGKRYEQSLAKIETSKLYSVEEALHVLKSFSFAKFDESVEVSLCLGVDAKQTDQQVRGAVVLPGGTGKVLRVLVFAKGEKEQEARAAGADIVGGDELVKRVADGFLDFDKVIATPDMMVGVGKLGKILGPRGLMPNPKLETVTVNVSKAVKEAKGGRVEFRTDKAGVLHALIGKASFSPDALKSNVLAFVDAVVRLKPSAAKGVYLKTMFLSTTMNPSVRVDLSSLV